LYFRFCGTVRFSANFTLLDHALKLLALRIVLSLVRRSRISVKSAGIEGDSGPPVWQRTGGRRNPILNTRNTMRNIFKLHLACWAILWDARRYKAGARVAPLKLAESPDL
jgi:hypothetical protein